MCTEHYQTKKTHAHARFLEEIGIAAPCFSATKSYKNEPYLTKSDKRGFAVNYTTMSYNELRSILLYLSHKFLK